MQTVNKTCHLWWESWSKYNYLLRKVLNVSGGINNIFSVIECATLLRRSSQREMKNCTVNSNFVTVLHIKGAKSKRIDYGRIEAWAEVLSRAADKRLVLCAWSLNNLRYQNIICSQFLLQLNKLRTRTTEERFTTSTSFHLPREVISQTISKAS